MASATSQRRPSIARRSPRCAPATQVDGVFACTRKERLIARTGAPYLTLELRDRTRRDRRPRLPRRRPARRALRARRAGARARARVERFREQLQIELDRDRARRAARGRPDARSCPSPTATSTSSTASSSTSRARSTTRACAALLDGAARRRAAARADPAGAVLAAARARLRRHHAYLGGLLEHTVAVATLALELVHAAPAAGPRPAADRRDRPRPRQDPRVHLRRGDRAQSRRGGCSGHVELGLRLVASARPGDARRGAACSRSSTACSATTAPSPPRASASASAEALALYRLNALDAQVKGAVEHGLARSHR